jgi:hypothetical protein
MPTFEERAQQRASFALDYFDKYVATTYMQNGATPEEIANARDVFIGRSTYRK